MKSISKYLRSLENKGDIADSCNLKNFSNDGLEKKYNREGIER
jgi:hypothetical protein